MHSLNTICYERGEEYESFSYIQVYKVQPTVFTRLTGHHIYFCFLFNVYLHFYLFT